MNSVRLNTKPVSSVEHMCSPEPVVSNPHCLGAPAMPVVDSSRGRWGISELQGFEGICYIVMYLFLYNTYQTSKYPYDPTFGNTPTTPTSSKYPYDPYDTTFGLHHAVQIQKNQK